MHLRWYMSYSGTQVRNLKRDAVDASWHFDYVEVMKSMRKRGATTPSDFDFQDFDAKTVLFMKNFIISDELLSVLSQTEYIMNLGE